MGGYRPTFVCWITNADYRKRTLLVQLCTNIPTHNCRRNITAINYAIDAFNTPNYNQDDIYGALLEMILMRLAEATGVADRTTMHKLLLYPTRKRCGIYKRNAQKPVC